MRLGRYIHNAFIPTFNFFLLPQYRQSTRRSWMNCGLIKLGIAGSKVWIAVQMERS